MSRLDKIEKRVAALEDRLTTTTTTTTTTKNNGQCVHRNERYGRCILERDHPPVDNGSGVTYAHKYEMRGALGNLDVREVIESATTVVTLPASGDVSDFIYRHGHVHDALDNCLKNRSGPRCVKDAGPKPVEELVRRLWVQHETLEVIDGSQVDLADEPVTPLTTVIAYWGEHAIADKNMAPFGYEYAIMPPPDKSRGVAYMLSPYMQSLGFYLARRPLESDNPKATGSRSTDEGWEKIS